MSGWKEFGKKLDDRIGRGTEKAGRILNRRTALRTVVLTGAATAGAVALGVRPAFASITCPDACGPSPLCSHGCPDVGCPAGHTLCKHPPYDCGGYCVWSTGTWVHCTGYGKCGQGFKLCQDCKPNNSCNICICISGVICRDCCTPRDVRAEQHRIQEILAASG